MIFKRITLSDLIDFSGEETAQKVLETFSCPQNEEIQNFIRNSAVNFAKRKITMTHLLFSEENELLGFFSLTHKPLIVKDENFSSKLRRIFFTSSSYNYITQSFESSGFLLAQFSKNFTDGLNKLISGNEMMNEVLNVLKPVQHEIGGRIVFLECDKNKEKLSDFYTNDNNRFVKFGERIDEKDNTTYSQLLRVL